MSDRSYRLIVKGRLAIQCLLCQRISNNPYDVSRRYCPWCHRFHEDQIANGKAATS